MTSIFLSYARNDDEPFVKRLYHDLVKRGFEVWWDRVSMPNRALTFHQEIRDAITACDRLILVVGPRAIRSKYVKAEWKWALESGKGINPVLRKGDFPLLPKELRLLDTPDFRDDSHYGIRIETLIRQLSEPLAPEGNLIDVPNLPEYFVTQPERLEPIKEMVLIDIHNPLVMTGDKARTGIHGMGGIGKSVLAVMLARDHEVRRVFPDGILWISLGETPNMLAIQQHIAEKLGYPGHFDNLTQGKVRLSQILKDKAVLLILDDLWDHEHAAALDILGSRCRMVVTTRDAALITAIGGTSYNLRIPDETQSLAIISEWSGVPVDLLPAAVKAVIRECGFLPLALSICGAMVRDGTSWADLLNALREADLAFLDHPRGNILKSIKISVDQLSDTESERFAELVIFPSDEAIPENAIVTLWGYTGQIKDRDARKLITRLANRALLHADRIAGATGTESIRNILFHDLIRDFLSALPIDTALIHTAFVEAYRKKLTGGWASSPDDGYCLQHISWHQIKAGMWEECIRTLSDQEFFMQCWKNNEYTIKIAWTLLEKERSVSVTANYDNVILNPEKYKEDFVYSLSELFSDTGNAEASLSLLRYLMKLYEEQKNEDKLQHIISDYAWSLYLLGNLDEAMRLYEEQEKICKRIHNRDGLQKCLLRMANIYHQKGDLKQAMRLYRQQQKICEKIGNIEYLEKSLGNQGLIYQIRGFPDKALRLYRQQEEVCKKYKFKDSLQKSFCNQGIIYATTGDYEKALDYFKRQEVICSEIGYKIGLQFALVNQGIICQHFGFLHKAIERYKQQQSICEKIHYFEGLQNSYANQGSAFFEQGDLDTAIKLFEKQKEISDQINFMDGYQSALGHLGEILLYQQKFGSAMELFQKQQEICKKIDNCDGLQQSLGNQGKIFESKNDLKNALILFKKQEQICQKIKNTDSLQVAIGRQAAIFQKYLQYNKALITYRKQQKICEKIKNVKDLSKCLIHQSELIILISKKERNTKRREKKVRIAQNLADSSFSLIKKTQFQLTIQYIEPKYNKVFHSSFIDN